MPDDRDRAPAAPAPTLDSRWAGDLARLETITEIVDLLKVEPVLYVRFSAGPQADAGIQSRDGESGCLLPGLSVNRLAPEPWWTRPVAEWVARQLCQYEHLAQDSQFPWVLTGAEVGRGPDSEPLVVRARPVAVVAPGVLDEAREIYHRGFAAGQLPDQP